MAFLGAYFDDSGTHSDSKIVTVAGIIATRPQMRKFNRKWGEALKSEGLEFFHMVDFAHSTEQFKKWKGNEEKRTLFLMRLHEIIRENSEVFLYSNLKTEDFELVRQEFPDANISAYQLCCEQCMTNIRDWITRFREEKQMAVMFEDSHHSLKSEGMELNFIAAESERLRKIYKITSIATGGKKEHKLLQAADLFAYEMYKYRERIDIYSIEQTRKSFAYLVEGKTIEGYWNTPDKIRFHFKLILAARQRMASLRSSFLKPCP